MNQLPRKRIFLLSTGFCAVAALCVFQRAKLRCEFVAWSDLNQSGERLYLDPRMPDEQAARVARMVAEARQRDAGIFGELQSEPVIIAGSDLSVMEKFGQVGNRTAVTHLLLGRAFIILGPDGLNIDVIAHEMMHAELYRRVGAWNRELKIPTWFDEGLAMQADNRDPFSEAQWQARTQGGKLAPDLTQLTTGRNFFAGDSWVNFATAKHEVRRWIKTVERQGLLDLIARINNHEDFALAYRQVEDKYRTLTKTATLRNKLRTDEVSSPR